MSAFESFGSTKMKGSVLMTNDAGEAIAVSCKVCGSFTLDTESCLCASCSLSAFIKDLKNLTLGDRDCWAARNSSIRLPAQREGGGER